MRRIWTLAVMPAAALLLGAGRATAARVPTAPTRPAAAVRGVSVVPAAGRVDVIVGIDADVRVQDFTLDHPFRIVVDLDGATVNSGAGAYDGIVRGSVKNVRWAQYRPNTVRVVIDLDAERTYEVVRSPDGVRVSVDGASRVSGAWYSGGNDPAPKASNAAEVMDVASTSGTVVRPVTAEPALSAPSAPSNASRPSRLQPAQQQQPCITVTYQDADIRDVIAAFATFSGRTIVIGKDVAGTVTAEIKCQPWDVALQAILATQGLAYSVDPQTGIITVDSFSNLRSKQSTEPLDVQTIFINYRSAAGLIEKARGLLLRDCGSLTALNPAGAAAAAAAAGQQAPAAPVPGAPSSGGPECPTRGTVTVDSVNNTLTVTEVRSNIDRLVQEIRNADLRIPQVSIKAKLIFVSRTNTENLGISYDIGTNAQFFNSLVARNGAAPGSAPTVAIGGDALSAVANASRSFSSSATSALNLIYTTMIGKFQVTAFLDALQEVRLADAQSEPAVVTLNNQLASILVGQEVPIRVVDASSTGGAGGARANVTFKEAGIRLDVTPRVAPNRQISLQVHAEQSALQTGGGDLGFFFNKRRADTQLLVGDGETAVIGGLTQTTVSSNKRGIPFLVDLPLLGRLFGETQTIEDKQDLLILITPHIVDEGETVRIR